MKEPQQIEMSYFGADDTLISTRRAANMLGVSDQTVRDQIEKNFIKAHRPWPGAQYRVSKKSIEEIKRSIARQNKGEEPAPCEGK